MICCPVHPRAIIEFDHVSREAICFKCERIVAVMSKSTTFTEYQHLAERTSDKAGFTVGEIFEGDIDDAQDIAIARLTNALLGLTGEAGECADYMKKVIFHGHPLDREKIKKEIGDVLWYCSELSSALDLDLGLVADANIAKLQARYPDGFDKERSKNRPENQLKLPIE